MTYSNRNPPTTAEVAVKRAPNRKRPPSELQAEAKRKLAELQAREAG